MLISLSAKPVPDEIMVFHLIHSSSNRGQVGQFTLEEFWQPDCRIRINNTNISNMYCAGTTVSKADVLQNAYTVISMHFFFLVDHSACIQHFYFPICFAWFYCLAAEQNCRNPLLNQVTANAFYWLKNNTSTVPCIAQTLNYRLHFQCAARINMQ